MRSSYSDIVKHSLFSIYIDNKEKHWQRGGRFVYSVVLLRGKADSSPGWEQILEGWKRVSCPSWAELQLKVNEMRNNLRSLIQALISHYLFDKFMHRQHKSINHP